MKKVLSFFVFAVLLRTAFGLERQPNADYHSRREALSKKTAGAVVVLFAPMEADGPNAVYGFRQDNNFYYLSGWAEPGAALVIAPAVEASGNTPARPYTEILFLAANNTVEEIRRFVEADTLGYLSLSALSEAVADDKHDYCYACYTGNYPTELTDHNQLVSIKK